jgi:hypothetical protein
VIAVYLNASSPTRARAEYSSGADRPGTSPRPEGSDNLVQRRPPDTGSTGLGNPPSILHQPNSVGRRRPAACTRVRPSADHEQDTHPGDDLLPMTTPRCPTSELYAPPPGDLTDCPE